MTTLRLIREAAKVGLFLGLLAFVQLYLATRSLTSLLAIPMAVVIFFVVVSVVAMFQTTPYNPPEHWWTARSAFELGLVTVLVVGGMVLRDGDVSPTVYLPMFVVGTVITVWSLAGARRAR